MTLYFIYGIENYENTTARVLLILFILPGLCGNGEIKLAGLLASESTSEDDQNDGEHASCCSIVQLLALTTIHPQSWGEPHIRESKGKP